MSKIIVIALKILCVITLVLTLISLLVMSLWNWLVPELFKGPRISIFQAGGLFILSRILFGGFFQKAGYKLKAHKKKFWRKKFAEKMAQMTPEDREKMEQKFKKWEGDNYWQSDQSC